MKRANRPDPVDRMSARQLRELLRVEREKGKGNASANLRRENDELTAQALRADARARALVNELGAARGEAMRRGVADEDVAGKPALAKMRRTWDGFSSAILRLPKTRREEGFGAVRLVVAKELVADLYLLSLVPPRGRVEAAERDRIRRTLDSLPFVALLSREERWADEFRALFLSQTARAYLRPSFWAIYAKGSDASLSADALGTVYK